METYFTEDSVNAIAEQSGFQILGQEVLPGSDAKFLPIPSCLDDRVRNMIAQDYPDGLYGHQAEAIDASLKGDDICLSTSTASGKSLVFMAVAVNLILRNNTTNPTSCFFAILDGRFYHFRIVAHVISIGYVGKSWM